MIELIRAAAEASPDHPAFLSETEEVDFATLLARAERAAAGLKERGIERFGILDDSPAIVWALLAASSLSGAEACVYPTAANDEMVAQLRDRMKHDVLVSTRPGIGEGLVDPVELTASDGPREQGDPPATRRLLVLTTGTSGLPQAAQHDWERVLRVAGRINPTPEHRWLLAYGLNQFGGLQILLHVASAHATLVSGRSFQPSDGLAAMRRFGVTHASGTPTFWRFLLAEIRADGEAPPPLRQVTLGGEAVPSALLDQLKATFTDARISQIYGATEMGQNITVRDGRPGLPLSVLEEGSGDVVFKIVDGELWVRSKSSMLGYFGQDKVEEGAWRATGDLVEVEGDRIMFRGRKSEVINVGGVKVHPLPLEEKVSGVEGVALAHAYGRPNALTGHIVALDVVPVAGVDEADLKARIKAACADLPPAARPRSISFVESVGISGNKVARGRRDD